jgi:hypothetical protein
VGLTWNFIQHMLMWKFRLKMRTFVELERIIWRTSKVFVFGNPYNTVLAIKPKAASSAGFRQYETVAGAGRLSEPAAGGNWLQLRGDRYTPIS